MRNDFMSSQYPQPAKALYDCDDVRSEGVTAKPHFAILVSNVLRTGDRHLSALAHRGATRSDVSGCQSGLETK